MVVHFIVHILQGLYLKCICSIYNNIVLLLSKYKQRPICTWRRHKIAIKHFPHSATEFLSNIVYIPKTVCKTWILIFVIKIFPETFEFTINREKNWAALSGRYGNLGSLVHSTGLSQGNKRLVWSVRIFFPGIARKSANLVTILHFNQKKTFSTAT
jgi:hypothetical protein